MSEVDQTLVARYALPPDEIGARSFEIISELLADRDQKCPEWPVIRRIVHTVGDPDIAPLVRAHPKAVAAAVDALRKGAPIVVDVKMVSAGITRSFTDRLRSDVLCAIDDPSVAESASARGVTRSIVAIERLAPRIPGAIVAIGNAPTALFALLDLLDAGLTPPAAIIGVPVGFVGAAESKDELVKRPYPYITIEGNRGGSSIAAAAVNALARLALEAPAGGTR